MKPQTMDAEIRELDASSTPQSGTTGLTALVSELQSGGKRDYVVIDFWLRICTALVEFATLFAQFLGHL